MIDDSYLVIRPLRTGPWQDPAPPPQGVISSQMQPAVELMTGVYKLSAEEQFHLDAFVRAWMQINVKAIEERVRLEMSS